MRHVVVPVFVAATLAAATVPTALGSVSLVSASRHAGGATSTAFGAFSESNTGSGFASPNGTGSWNSSQTSDISITGATFTASYGGGITSGGPQVTYSIPGVRFQFVFNVTGAPQDMTYSWSGGLFGQFPSITGSPIGTVSLYTNGATQSLTLPVGQYTVNASDNMFFSAQSITGGSRSNTGSIAFVPAPGAAGMLGVAGLVAVRRRRMR